MSTAARPTPYDVFVSHAPGDLSHAQRLATVLVDAGLRVFLLEWAAPGVVECAEKEAALQRSANGVLIFSRATMADPGIVDDYAALLWRVHTGGRRFVPVTVEDVQLPPFAAIRKPVDLRDVHGDEYGRRVAALIEALRPADQESPVAAGSLRALGDRTQRARIEVRMGFAVDVVQYSRRSAPMKEAVQQRLARMALEVVGDLTPRPAEVAVQSTGDGLNAFLPAAVEIHLALPALVHSWRDRLTQDNEQYRDRLRLRMSAAIGPVGLSAMGFTGSTIIELSRLLDSAVLRQAIIDHEAADLALLVSSQLHAYVIADGYPGLDPAQFHRCEVAQKEYSDVAWLLIACRP
jgi:class 3 adenylate cyclase